MKRTFLLLAVLVFSLTVFSQLPEKMSYQAVVRNSSNTLVKNTQIGLQVSILQGTVAGQAVYREKHVPTTNENGLVSVEIGGGTVVAGSFSSIDWQSGSYFVKTEIDLTGGSNYTLTSVSQLLSVPYALFAKTAETVITEAPETDPIFGLSVAAGITGTDTSYWNSKLNSESDPLYNASVAATITQENITNWDNKLETETDSIFLLSAAGSITSENISNWDNKLDAEIDGDITNEIQCLSVSRRGDTLSISGCNYVIVPGISAANYLPNSLTVESSPAGAAIYLNGSNTGKITPATLTNITPNSQNFVRVYLEGYNEYWETFQITTGGNHYINVNLQTPGYPRPVFTFTSPVNGNTYNSNVITVSGTIQLADSLGNLTPFVGTTAILNLNGYDQQIAVSNGNFSLSISIRSGENRIQLKANSAAGQTGVSNVLTVTGNFVGAAYEVILTWNTPTSDMDLHVWNPSGVHCYYYAKSTTFGSLDIDDIEGYGPETFKFKSNPTPGKYIVKINSYSLDRDSFSDCVVQVNSQTAPTQSFGPKRFTVGDQNGSNASAWWQVLEITVGASQAPLTAADIQVFLQSNNKK